MLPNIDKTVWTGYVAAIRDGVAYLDLKDEFQQELWGEYAAAELAQAGIVEHQRFTVESIIENGEGKLTFTPIPFKEISAARMKEIDDSLKFLEEDGLEGDY